jgi:hypothetical protein
MFSKGVVLIFLLLGLSSSIAHAIPHQNRASESNPCDVRLFPLDQGRFRISHHIQDTATGPKSSPVLVSSDVSKNTTTDKGISTSCLIHGTVLIARQKAATFPNQEMEARPHSPALPTTRTVQILRAMAKTIPQSMTMAKRI